MNHLVISLIVLFVAAYCEATLFSWRSSTEAKESDPLAPGYLPILKIRKYSGIQLDPIQGSPIYLPNEPNNFNDIEKQTTQLSHEQLLQLDLVNRLATFLPSGDNLREVDVSAVLPYVDLISEDNLEKFKYTIETNKPKEKSKILKFIAFLKYLKEKKLKPFKYVAGLGSSFLHGKKNWLFGSATKTSEPFAEIPAPITGPYNTVYPNPTFTPHEQFLNSFPTLNAVPSVYSPIQTEHIQKQPSQSPAEFLNQPTAPLEFSQASGFPQFPAIQFPIFFPSAQFQPNHAPLQNLPFQPQNQYPSLTAPSAEPTKTLIAYNYEQIPAHDFATQDTLANRQFVSFNQAKTSSIPSFNVPQQSFQYLPAQGGYIDAGEFFTASSNDLTAAGSENVEKTNEEGKPENLKNDAESLKINNVVTSNEISVSKSQPSSPEKPSLRPVAISNPIHSSVVYSGSVEDENSKDNNNISSQVISSTTN